MMLFDLITLGSLSVFYSVHLIISALVAWLGSYFLSFRYKDKRLQSFALLFFFNIALPGIGYIFTIWLSYYLRHVTYAKVLKNAKSINMEELDQDFPRVKRVFGEGSLVDLMADTLAPQELRMKALSVMAENMTKKNVSVIKNSLSERDDEIRLFCFSLIENMEQGLNNKIHEASLRYKNEATDELRLKAGRELAFLYWEMIYFDLSDDVLKEYLINQSYHYAIEVFYHNMHDTGINVLLGRIHLEKNDYEKATTQFIMAIESGVEHEYIIPYLAELYYSRGNYKSIRSMLSYVKNLRMNATMYPVVEQWRKHA